jgi:drug/metabolite transporter (DMT)-like permease
MAVAGRALAGELDTFEIMMFRSLIGAVLVIGAAGALGTLNQISRRSLHIHVVRNVFHFAGQNLWFFSLTFIPLAQVFALEFTSPLWVTVLAPLILGERLTRIRTLAAAIGFLGILIVARPGFTEVNIGVAAAAASAIGFAGSILFTKFLTRTEKITCILFWLTVTQSVFGIVCAGWDGDIAWPSATAWPWLAVVAFGGLLAHLCLTTALSIAPATIVVPFDFIRLPVIALVGVVLYAEALDPFVLIGAAVIFGANYLNIWTETRTKKLA